VPPVTAPRAILLVRNAFTHDARVLRAAHSLRDRGYEPLVVSVMSTHVRRATEVVDGVAVLRLDPRSPFRPLRRLVRRPRLVSSSSRSRSPARSADALSLPAPLLRFHRLLRTADFYRRAFRVVRRERPVLLQCNDYNTMWVGVLTRLTSRTAVVYDSHELWPDRNGRPEPRWWLMACEALFVRVAHVVMVASPGYADVMARRYRIPRPIVVLNVPRAPLARPAAVAARPDLAVYVGGMQAHRGLEPAIQALALVPGLELRLLGPGRSDYRAGLRDLAVREGVTDRVDFAGIVPPGEVLDAVRDAAFGLALFEPTCLSHRLVAPNKLYEYTAAGVPVLTSDLPVMRAFVEEWGLGAVAPSSAPSDVAAAMRQLLDPETNLELRHRTVAAAAQVTWARERQSLDAAYDCALAAA